MNPTVACYLLYLPLSVALTIWVAATLHKNGRVFLVEAFHGNGEMADSVNHLLVVGFYLINIGYIALALRYGDKPNNVQEAFEFLSTKLGLVLIVLGAMHFFNMFNFDKMRRKARRGHDAPPFVPNPTAPWRPDAKPLFNPEPPTP